MLTLRSTLVLIFALLVPASVPALEGQDLRVVDGDSIVLNGERIRLFGIDAPEHNQPCDPSGRNWECGEWSAETLRGFAAVGPVRCDAVDRDRFGRTVAICTVAGRDLGAEMVRAGAAVAYVKYSTRYVAQERAARAEARGMWNGVTAEPESFRHPVQQRSTPMNCAIKGNVSANGERIYHMPGQAYYAKAKISPAKGEAYFCSEAEARAAGFRKARK